MIHQCPEQTVTSHGLVGAKRRGDLPESLQYVDGWSSLCLVLPLSREDMRKYLNRIALETEVWRADNPTHLIHFNGERFLGPYED